MNLTKVAIGRPVFVLMLMLIAIVMGLIGYSAMRKEQNPDVSFGIITVLAVYPGANPEEVATLVSRPLEEAVSGVNGIRDVTSTSVEGRSIVQIQFEIGSDMNVGLNDVRAKVDGILSSLPDDVEKPTIAKVDTAATPVLYMAMSASRTSSRELRTLVDDKLKDRFARIPGVAEVGVQGGDIREIQVAIKKDQLLRYGIGLSNVQQAIAAATQNVPSGRVVSGDSDVSVRVPGEFESIDELENLVFSVADPKNPQAKGRLIRLKDVAKITDGVKERTAYSTLNGTDTIVMVLTKATEGNAIQIVEQAKALGKDLKTEYKSIGLNIVNTQDQAKRISEGLEDLNVALVFGIILVAAIVFLFLHDWRGTLIVVLAIPTCICATFAALKIFGFTINNLTMLALSLAVGVLVDDAIVVIENIYRHLKMGEDPRDAAVNGRAEIGLAAIAITLADVVVFLPLAFVGGIVGQFFRPLALAYVIAVLFSLFVSFTLTPMLASRWYRAGEDMEHPKTRFAAWFERMFTKFENGYRRVLEWSLNHRWFVFISGNVVLFAVFVFIGGANQPDMKSAFGLGLNGVRNAAIVSVLAIICNLAFYRRFKPLLLIQGLLFGLVFPVAAVIGFQTHEWKKEAVFKFQFFPASDTGSLNVNIQLPPGRNLASTEAVVKRVEAAIKGVPEIEFTLATIGTQGVSQFQAGTSGSNYAQIVVSLYEKGAFLDKITFWKKHEGFIRSRSSDAVSAELIQRIGRVPGAEIRVAATDGFGAGGAVQLSLSGPDRNVILDTASKIKRGLQGGAVPGIINPDISSKPGKPELRAEPDRVRLADNGLSVLDLAQALRIAYTGDETVKYREDGREYTIRTMLDLEDRNDPNILATLPIRFRQGEAVYVSSVADLKPGTGTDKVERRNRAEEVRVSADLLPGFAAGTAGTQIDAWLAKEKIIPADVKIRPLGQAESQARESAGLLAALGLGLLLVYMVLASLYDNLLYPLIIQLAQPQAFVGALLALIITDKPFSLIGFIGLIALIGLVGKNAILLVDYANTLRERGRSRHDALVESGPTRLRPIMMTTLALVLGTLPTALAIGRGSEFRETLGIVIIGGIALSTILTLVVIPCSYTIFDDASIGIGKARQNVAKFFGKKPPTPPAVKAVEPAEAPDSVPNA